jgi:hypothetical protein
MPGVQLISDLSVDHILRIFAYSGPGMCLPTNCLKFNSQQFRYATPKFIDDQGYSVPFLLNPAWRPYKDAEQFAHDGLSSCCLRHFEYILPHYHPQATTTPLPSCPLEPLSRSQM